MNSAAWSASALQCASGDIALLLADARSGQCDDEFFYRQAAAMNR